MKCSPPVRISEEDYKEINAIKLKYNLKFPQAFNLWKKRKIGGKWEPY